MASLIRKSLAVLRAPGNSVRYQIRSRMRWSRGSVALSNESKDELFDWLDAPQQAAAQARERELRARFDLAELHGRSSVVHYAENLALLETFGPLFDDRRLPVGDDGVLRATDVGSGVFHYATALHRLLARAGAGESRRVVLRGVEVDGHGVYRDLHSRADHARAHAALAATDAHFHVADFVGLRLPEQDVVTMFFPFLTAYPLLQWGLPIGLFRPRHLLRRAVAALRPGGLLIVANQTVDEFARLRRLLHGESVEHVAGGPLATDLVPYVERTRGRYGSVWMRR